MTAARLASVVMIPKRVGSARGNTK